MKIVIQQVYNICFFFNLRHWYRDVIHSVCTTVYIFNRMVTFRNNHQYNIMFSLHHFTKYIEDLITVVFNTHNENNMRITDYFQLLVFVHVRKKYL